jgi:hypothetical protein
MAGSYTGIWWNLFFGFIISWTGGLGLFIMRFMKGNWGGQIWSYLPIFWIPVLFSWPVALAALFGFYD